MHMYIHEYIVIYIHIFSHSCATVYSHSLQPPCWGGLKCEQCAGGGSQLCSCLLAPSCRITSSSPYSWQSTTNRIRTSMKIHKLEISTTVVMHVNLWGNCYNQNALNALARVLASSSVSQYNAHCSSSISSKAAESKKVAEKIPGTKITRYYLRRYLHRVCSTLFWLKEP